MKHNNTELKNELCEIDSFKGKRKCIEDNDDILDTNIDKSLSNLMNKKYCKICEYVARDPYTYNRHVNSKKHKLRISGEIKTTKQSVKGEIKSTRLYQCKDCTYTSIDKSNLKKKT